MGVRTLPPGVVLRRSSVEEELSELRSYEMWLRFELESEKGDRGEGEA
jgi:hypothetical protein